MRYVIMANGRGTRWGEYGGIPKHLIRIGGETLLRRIVRQVSTRDPDAEIIVSSWDPRCETPGARRYVPLVNELELDRFVPELIVDPVCFLYGDTYYNDYAMARIVSTPADELAFFGDTRSIVAVKSGDSALLLRHLDRVRWLYVSGEIASCLGWQLYQSYAGVPFGPPQVGERFHVLEGTAGFNSPADLADFVRRTGGLYHVDLGAPIVAGRASA